MRAFNVPAAYRPFIEAQIRLAVAEVKRDVDRREDEDERVQRLATVPDQFIDHGEKGSLTILVGVGDTDSLRIAVASGTLTTQAPTS